MQPLDLQLNGYKGIDFNADGLSALALRQACAAVRAEGGGRMLATVITDRLDRMTARIGRLTELRAADELVLPATVTAAQRLVAAGRGLVRLVTLAPEHDAGYATTRWLADQGILVSAGHCDPPVDVLDRAIDAGLAAFTHLGNGCPLTLHRHDNVIQRVLAADRLRWVMLIPDAVHLPPAMVRTVIRAVGITRVIAVTDATAAGGMGVGRFSLAGQEVLVDAGGAAWAADRSHLVGSTASMARIRQVLRDLVGLTAEEIRQTTEINPARALADATRGA